MVLKNLRIYSVSRMKRPRYSAIATPQMPSSASSPHEYTQTMAAAKAAIRTSQDCLHEQELKRIADPRSATTKGTGKSLQTPPSNVDGTCLSGFSALHRRCCRTPPNLPTHCYGCGAKFYIAHGFECKNGGLVIQRRHDKIKFELQDLATRALIPCVVRGESRIYPGHK